MNHAINRKLKSIKKTYFLFSKNPSIRYFHLMNTVEERDNKVYGDTYYAKGRKMSQIIERNIGD